MEAGNKQCNNATCLGLCYDILAQLISILDVTTDIIVCIGYYQKDRLAFFGISITILLLALIAYDIAFLMNFNEEDKIGRRILFFLVMLPISPFVPYLLYFTADNKSKFSKFLEDQLCCFDIRISNRSSVDTDSSKLRQFMESKIEKHLGFIIEALVEGIIFYIHSFSQSNSQ